METPLTDDESEAFELLRALTWDDLVHPYKGIPRVVASFNNIRARDKKTAPPMAAAVNWEGLAKMFGVPVEKVRDLALATPKADPPPPTPEPRKREPMVYCTHCRWTTRVDERGYRWCDNVGCGRLQD